MLLDFTITLSIISYGLAYSTIAAFNFIKVSPGKQIFTMLPTRMSVGFFLLFYTALCWFFEITTSDTIELPTAIYDILLCSFLLVPNKQTEDIISEFDGINISLVGFGLLLGQITDLFTIMIVVEIISLYLYTIASLSHDEGTTAGARYFIYGSFMATVGYTGLLLIYQAVGSFDLQSIQLITEVSTLGFIGLSLFLSYIFFKLGIFPFHSWVPLVYTGLSFQALYIFAIASKFFFGHLLFIILECFATNAFALSWLQKIFIIILFGNMIYGTIGSLLAVRINELLAYSSIVHMGYMLLPLTTINSENFADAKTASFSYLIYYTLSVALFLVTCSLVVKPLTFITDLNYKFSLPTYLGFVISLLSIAGLPPTIGFLAKWNVWSQLILTDQLTVDYTVIFQNINLFIFIFSLSINVISIWFYIKIILSPKLINQNLVQSFSQKPLIYYLLISLVTFGPVFFPII